MNRQIQRPRNPSLQNKSRRLPPKQAWHMCCLSTLGNRLSTQITDIRACWNAMMSSIWHLCLRQRVTFRKSRLVLKPGKSQRSVRPCLTATKEAMIIWFVAVTAFYQKSRMLTKNISTLPGPIPLQSFVAYTTVRRLRTAGSAMQTATSQTSNASRLNPA